MKVAKTIVSLVAAGLFSVAIAQDEARVKIEFSTDQGGGENVHIALGGDDLGVNLHDMQEGENQAIVDEQGRTILITREADGFRFEVDGKSIKMPLLDGIHDGEHAVRIVKKVEVVTE